MQSYNYRSVKAIAEYRYPRVKNNHSNRDRSSSHVWRDEWHEPSPVKRKQRSNNRAPDRSRAA